MSKEKFHDVLVSQELVIITASAKWCGYCQKFSSVFEEVSREHGKQYKFAKVDVQEEVDFSQLFKISAFPTTIFIKNGKEIGREMGYMNKEDFTAKIAKHFNH